MGTTNRRAIAITSAALLALTLAATPVAAQDEATDEDALARILAKGQIVMSTDPRYEPQSFINDDGVFEGFDIDVGTEIADRLGVELVATPVIWEVITAGTWANRFDMSVGSMTQTTPRLEVIDFSRPYYAIPAQMAARADLGYTSPEDLAGQTICVGAATTYLAWMDGTLDMGDDTPTVAPPEGSSVVTRETDTDCATEWGANRTEFEGWISSVATVENAIEAGLPVVKLGGPLFNESLRVAFDKTVEDNDSLVAAVDQIVGEMLGDGTLSELTLARYGEDLTATLGEYAIPPAE
jgi:polar amino acid transport system substrate-binding protein